MQGAGNIADRGVVLASFASKIAGNSFRFRYLSDSCRLADKAVTNCHPVNRGSRLAVFGLVCDETDGRWIMKTRIAAPLLCLLAAPAFAIDYTDSAPVVSSTPL